MADGMTIHSKFGTLTTREKKTRAFDGRQRTLNARRGGEKFQIFRGQRSDSNNKVRKEEDVDSTIRKGSGAIGGGEEENVGAVEGGQLGRNGGQR